MFELKNIFPKLPIFFIILISVFAGIIFISEFRKTEREIQSLQKPTGENNILTLIFTGDIMMDRGVEYSIRQKGNGDFKFPFLKIADFLKDADILVGNLESPISDKGEKVGSIYSFRSDLKAIEGLSFAGFDILSVANNHAFDYGRLALEDTLLRL
ncbi:MAG: CapA family protein, partial [Candidatus Parcubacteria bacterium]|nr:CapA family protein [Candidatus Parcubacteria bacterium]